MRTGTITLSIGSRLDDVFLVGLAVNKICGIVPLDEAGADEAELCVVEAVNNAIEHGYANEPGPSVDVVISLCKDAVTFSVRAGGPEIDPSAWEHKLSAPPADDLLAESGRGLFIIRSLMDELRYERDGEVNVLTFVKRLTCAVVAG